MISCRVQEEPQGVPPILFHCDGIINANVMCAGGLPGRNTDFCCPQIGLNMFRYTTLVWIAALVLCNAANAQDVLINEVDVDNAGSDTAEFIELIGTPNASLDGLLVVAYNGLDDMPYAFFDLDGQVIGDNGFFVIGGPDVPNVDLLMESNLLQNGPEAIGLYMANEADFMGQAMPLVDASLIDALVYGTNDADDPELLALLNPGQMQVNESGVNGSSVDAMARVPNGGVARNTDTYQAQAPTPGESNELVCSGGSIYEINDLDAIAICSNEPFIPYTFGFITETPDPSYALFVASAGGTIVLIPDGDTFSFESLPDGNYTVLGLSYTGTLDEAAFAEGQPVDGVFSDECYSVADFGVPVDIQDCTPPVCFANGLTTVDDGLTNLLMCMEGGNQEVELDFDFDFTDSGFLLYVLADLNNEIIETSNDNVFDLENYGEGEWNIWAVAYTGMLFDATIQPGQPVDQIDADGCTSISTNSVNVVRLDCVSGVGCYDLFISEYIEGSSNNKALEIVNPTTQPIDLSQYTLYVYNNGSTSATNSLTLSGTIAPGDVIVVVSPDAAASWIAYADFISQVTWFSGNDPVALFKNNVQIDGLGEIGYNSSAPIPVTGGNMELHTLRRDVTVTQGTTDWDLGQTQWDVFPANTINGLGFHQFIPCDNSNEPSITFELASEDVEEGQAAVVSVVASNVSGPISVEVTLSSESTATPVTDFDNVLPQTLTFGVGGATVQNIVFLTEDDEEAEETETVELVLNVFTNNVAVGIDTTVVNILDNDQPIPVYTIQEIAQSDETTGIADSLDVYCEIRGLVYGENLRPEALQFTLGDSKDGIQIYTDLENYGYTVNERDSLHVVGTIAQFNGLTQMLADTVIFIQSNLELEDPEEPVVPNEEMESRLMALYCFSLVDPAQWTNVEPGFNVEITNGDVVAEMRIDADVDLFGSAAPEGVFDLLGIGGQFDPDEPYLEGYQIQPRYQADILPLFNADFAVDAGFFVVNNGDTCLVFEPDQNMETQLTATGSADAYNWVVNGTALGAGAAVTFSSDAIGWSAGEAVTVVLEATVGECTYSVERTYCGQVDTSVGEQLNAGVSIFPNPFQENVEWIAGERIELLEVYTLDGRRIVRSYPEDKKGQLNSADWPAGSYVIRLHSRNGTVVRQLIKG